MSSLCVYGWAVLSVLCDSVSGRSLVRFVVFTRLGPRVSGPPAGGLRVPTSMSSLSPNGCAELPVLCEMVCGRVLPLFLVTGILRIRVWEMYLGAPGVQVQSAVYWGPR